jgi:hypothetical protein
MLAPMDLVPILGAAKPLDELVDREVECHVLVRARRLGPDEGAGSDEGKFDTIVAAGAELLVVAADSDLERKGLVGQVGDLLGLFRCIRPESVRDSNVAAGDGNVHGSPRSCSARCPVEPGDTSAPP